MRRMLAGVVGLAAVAASVSAQPFIEIRFDVVADSGGPTAMSGGWYIFDASAAPIIATPDILIFTPVAGAFYSQITPTSTAVRPAPTPVPPSSLDGVFFQYIVASDSWDLGPYLGVYSLPAGAFSAGMTSLPDDPADYMSTGPGAKVQAFAQTCWTPAGGFVNGTVTYSVSVVDDPNPCPADMDGNGILNLDDLDAFVAGFLGGCP